jgi:NADH-quinone oxidoreductase subunit C
MQIKVNLIQLVPLKLIKSITCFDQNIIITSELTNLRTLLIFFKNSSFFKMNILTDVVCIDNLNAFKRFELIYCLISSLNGTRVFVKIFIDDNESVPSIVDIFPSSIWLEREIWDMYGVFFNDHPDLRRILTDYGFDGHPLKKDFPLSGFVELRYDDESKKILIEPVSLTQEFRYFDFSSPWDLQKT